MMRDFLTIASVVMMTLALVPVASAETVTEEYVAGGARVAGVGRGIVVCPGTDQCDLDGDGNRDVGPIGGARLYASTFYNNVVVSTTDDIYGTNGGFSVCFWNPDGDTTCSDDDYSTGTGCGTRALTGAPFAGNYVTTFIYTFVVTEDLDQCGASSGSITGDFF